MLFLTNNDSQMFQSCQHVLLGVQHFLCRFPDISMSFFREHSEMFWRANDNLPLIPSNMDGVIKCTLRLERCYGLEGNVRWGVHFCRRGQTKEKSSQPSSVCVSSELHTPLSEDLKTWRRTRHEKQLNRAQSHSTLRRHLKHYHTVHRTNISHS